MTGATQTPVATPQYRYTFNDDGEAIAVLRSSTDSWGPREFDNPEAAVMAGMAYLEANPPPPAESASEWTDPGEKDAI